ncbi:hypothetical protein [Anaerotruncus rubiinfantis]|uniref:hypothetical protein n=1 Tax=Anaerotruncus rubiinfantis TaxID=1720200 RepID=UPI00082B5297|nr:hypothetical protein [Anaerotruncus rubiinfantis]
MIIKVDSFRDFAVFLSNCTSNGVTDIRVCISHAPYWGARVLGSERPATNTSFAYVLFAPMFTVVYSSQCPNAEYEEVEKKLYKLREQDDLFRVMEFEKIEPVLKENYILISGLKNTF